MEELFFQIGSVFVIVAILSMVMFRLHLPLILAYILSGIYVGYSIHPFVEASTIFAFMSQIGVAFLLFTVGLGLNWRNSKDVGGIALATGFGQVIFTTLFGFGLSLLLGFSTTVSLYLAIAFTFSSTIIVVKSLSDKEDADTLYGRLSIGLLLVQDFVAMVILLIHDATKNGSTIDQVFLTSFFKAIIIIPILWFIATKVIPKILSYVAKSQELLFVFAIGWCFLIANILSYLGFGIELGALISGITLSGSVFYREIFARIRPLRDFFLIMFFIVLGTHIQFDGLLEYIIPILVFSLFILIGNPLIVFAILRSFGYHPRTGFLTGTTIAQVSEFSFIIISAGISTNHLPPSILGFATVVGLITITGSTFLIEHNQKIYEWLHPYLKWLEPKMVLKIELKQTREPTDIFLFGFHRTGQKLLDSIKSMKKTFTIVDFDPVVVGQLQNFQEPVVYGDVSDENFLDELRVRESQLIISTVPELSVSSALLTFLKNEMYKGIAVVSVHTQEEAEACYDLGATYVIVPSQLSGAKVAELLQKGKTLKSNWKKLSSTMLS